jgi:predicted RND superfamily exporter protein
LVSQIPKLEIDTSTEGFLHDDDPTLLAYNAFRDQFGRDEVIIVAIKPPNIFTPSFLEKLKSLHEEFEENVPYIDDITSLVNARNTRGEKDELIVEDLLENWPQNEEHMAALKTRVLSNPMYTNLLISEEGDYTTVVIKTHSHSMLGQTDDVLEGFEDSASDETAGGIEKSEQTEYLTDEENSRVVAAVRKIVANYQADDFQTHIAGSPIVTHFLKRSIMKDMRKFVALVADYLIAPALMVVVHRKGTGKLNS